MKINVNIQDKNLMRYDTLGDYHYVKFLDTLVFDIADTGNDVYNKLILIHELVEELLTSQKGIKEEDIMKWDKEHLDSEDPGSIKTAPYHKEHKVAEKIEKFLIEMMNMSWTKYEKELNKL